MQDPIAIRFEAVRSVIFEAGALANDDCLGAMAVIDAASGKTNECLTGDALVKGNCVVAGPPFSINFQRGMN
jgi:hypothetical protein